MKRRNPAAVVLLPLITFGIYSFVWYAKTRGELNNRGAEIPTTWLIIVPTAGYFYLWRFAAGVARVTGSDPVGAFVLLLLLGGIGGAIVQSSLNTANTENQ